MAQASPPRASRSVAGHAHGRVPRAVRVEQLLEIAKRLFAARGYHATSIEEIARSAGVTRPIVYEHFGSKDGVYLACLRRAREQLDEVIAAAAGSGGDPGEQLWRGINAYFEFIERDAPAWDVLFGPGAAVTGAAAKEVTLLRFSTVERIARLIAPYVPEANPEAVEAFAHALSGSGEQLAKWWRENGHLSREQVAGYHMAFAWLGLRELIARRGEQ
jgi:AcrR family transcriptional regulator